MADKTLKLGSITTIADGFKIGSIMLNGDAIGASVTVAADAAKSINLNNVSGKNYGSLNIDKDGNLDADDAYLILLYYAQISVGADVTWEDLTQ